MAYTSNNESKNDIFMDYYVHIKIKNKRKKEKFDNN